MSEFEGLTSPIKKPSLFWLATEGQRALLELSTFLPYRLMKSKKRYGDQHPVLVLPGFMASDISTAPLRSFINTLGYSPYPWGIGRNLGEDTYLDILVEKAEDIFLKHRSKVSIVGWSLGGVFAREIAKKRPEIVRQVMTMGSPFGGLTEPNNAQWIHNLLTGGRGSEDVNPELLANLHEPAAVPTTAIYTKEDGVVNWKVCREKKESAIHENVQVRGSHIGLGINPVVLDIIENRLQLKQDNWQRLYPIQSS